MVERTKNIAWNQIRNIEEAARPNSLWQVKDEISNL
jgi:hypothetical protein